MLQGTYQMRSLFRVRWHGAPINVLKLNDGISLQIFMFIFKFGLPSETDYDVIDLHADIDSDNL